MDEHILIGLLGDAASFSVDVNGIYTSNAFAKYLFWNRITTSNSASFGKWGNRGLQEVIHYIEGATLNHSL
jgi:hypothetical protein